jgi:hypothetical protein
LTWGLFGITFEDPKSVFNSQKIRLKKKSTCLVKKIKSVFKGSKAKKFPKRIFDKRLKMKLLPKNIF